MPKKFNPRFKRYTQDTFFGPQASQVKSLAQVYGKTPKKGEKPDYGLQIRQLKKMLNAHGVSAELRIADKKVTNRQIKEEMIDALKNKDKFVIANFVLQESLVAKGTGHVSPVVAYDRKSDSFLVMDVHPYHRDWFWVESKNIINSMRTRDTVENRGYIVVSDAS